MKFMLILSLLLGSSSGMACLNGASGFLPERNYTIPVGLKSAGKVTEAQFNEMIDRVETHYAPIVAGMGGKLVVNRLWSNGTVNANAEREGGTWILNMYGGLARHPSITADGFALAVCHELGHHIGGAPKFSMGDWATNEGQSDYFATTKCLRQIFLTDDNKAIVAKLKVPKEVSALCKKIHRKSDDTNICIRNAMAGKSVAELFAEGTGVEPKFDTPDNHVVIYTSHSHPAAQCRLDTYFQGAVCGASMNDDVSQTDEVPGTCHKKLGHTYGLRPNCWFKPKN